MGIFPMTLRVSRSIKPLLRTFSTATLRLAQIAPLVLFAAVIADAQPSAQQSQPDSQQNTQITPQNDPPASTSKHGGPACVSVTAATQEPNKDICVSAHVFDVVELADGTRFLDVCPADVPDDQCRFTLLSLRTDREDVGDLHRYRDQNVRVRGIVRITHGRMGIVISHVRQFSGGPEKFRPNPRLLHDFNAESDRTPVRDPNLKSSGRHRGFMNTRDTESLPKH